MDNKELRQLDQYIAEHVMGWKWYRFKRLKTDTAINAGDGYEEWQQLIPPSETWHLHPIWGAVACGRRIEGLEDCTDLSMFKPTTDPAGAMEVLKKCAEKKTLTIEFVYYDGPNWRIYEGADIDGGVYSETLEHCACLFARQLFQKEGV